jgi:tetratricopeptide (TPR) repeat protein
MSPYESLLRVIDPTKTTKMLFNDHPELRQALFPHEKQSARFKKIRERLDIAISTCEITPKDREVDIILFSENRPVSLLYEVVKKIWNYIVRTRHFDCSDTTENLLNAAQVWWHQAHQEPDEKNKYKIQSICHILIEKCKCSNTEPKFILLLGQDEEKLEIYADDYHSLCLESDFLNNLFTNGFQETSKKQAKLPSIQASTFRKILSHMTQDEIHLHVDEFNELFEAATFLQMKNVQCKYMDCLADSIGTVPLTDWEDVVNVYLSLCLETPTDHLREACASYFANIVMIAGLSNSFFSFGIKQNEIKSWITKLEAFENKTPNLHTLKLIAILIECISPHLIERNKARKALNDFIHEAKNACPWEHLWPYDRDEKPLNNNFVNSQNDYFGPSAYLIFRLSQCHYFLGDESLKNDVLYKEYDDCVFQFTLAIRENPPKTEDLIYHALLLCQSERALNNPCFLKEFFNHALFLLDQIIITDPSYTPLIKEIKASLFLKNNSNTELIVKELEDHTDFFALCMKTTGSLKMSNFKDALFYIDQTLNLDPENPIILFNRSQIYYMNGQIEESLTELNKLIKEPHDQYLLLLLSRANIYRYQNRIEEALCDLKLIILAEPNNFPALLVRSDLHRMQGKLDDALIDVNQAIPLNPGNYAALIIRGDVYRLQNRLDEALIDLNLVITTIPLNAQALGFRGDVHRLKGNLELALGDLLVSDHLNPYQIFVLSRIIDCYLQIGLLPEAKKYVHQCLQINANEPFPTLLNAEILYKEGLFDEAQVEFAKADILFGQYKLHIEASILQKKETLQNLLKQHEIILNMLKQPDEPAEEPLKKKVRF